MVKKIIFDLDDTLIKWQEENWDTLLKTAQKLNVESINEHSIPHFIEIYRKFLNESNLFTKENITNYMNENSRFIIPEDFIDEWIKELSTLSADIPDDVHNTLKYLSNKYELIVLTNWFVESQTSRLRNGNILKYFTKIYGIDNTYPKPNVKAFKQVFQDNNPKDYMMIGDNQYTDTIPAYDIGMHAIWYNHKKEKIIRKEITVITNFEELKELL